MVNLSQSWIIGGIALSTIDWGLVGSLMQHLSSAICRDVRPTGWPTCKIALAIWALQAALLCGLLKVTGTSNFFVAFTIGGFLLLNGFASHAWYSRNFDQADKVWRGPEPPYGTASSFMTASIVLSLFFGTYLMLIMHSLPKGL